MRKHLTTLLLAVTITSLSAAQPHPIDWEAAADSATTALIKHFWNENGYFNEKADAQGKINNGNSWNYWPQAHAMDIIIDAYERTGRPEYKEMFGKWFDCIKSQNDGGNTGGYTNDFYDDEAWIATTMTRLYKVTNDEKYLNVAIRLFDDIWNGWNSLAGGGLAWRKSQPYSKNACINGPAAILSLHLYDITKDDTYLTRAAQIYDWTRKHLFNPSSGEVYDNLNADTGTLTKWHFTYNQATMMKAAMMLHRITDKPEYGQDATMACNYVVRNEQFVDAARNLTCYENGSLPAGDAALFRAVFYHYFHDMITTPDCITTSTPEHTLCFQQSTETLWRDGLSDRNSFVLFGPDWANGPTKSDTVTLNAMVSACAAIEMRAKYEKSQTP